jgi:hypothetical protein
MSDDPLAPDEGEPSHPTNLTFGRRILSRIASPSRDAKICPYQVSQKLEKATFLESLGVERLPASKQTK